jgi:ketosteroid isomerase-like protein
MSTEQEVSDASNIFYTALNRMLNGDAGPLADIWAHSAAVTTMHPVGGRDVGWDQVGKSWQQVAAISTGGQVELRERRIQVEGDLAYEVGAEYGKATLAG